MCPSLGSQMERVSWCQSTHPRRSSLRQGAGPRVWGLDQGAGPSLGRQSPILPHLPTALDKKIELSPHGLSLRKGHSVHCPRLININFSYELLCWKALWIFPIFRTKGLSGITLHPISPPPSPLLSSWNTRPLPAILTAPRWHGHDPLGERMNRQWAWTPPLPTSCPPGFINTHLFKMFLSQPPSIGSALTHANQSKPHKTGLCAFAPAMPSARDASFPLSQLTSPA